MARPKGIPGFPNIPKIKDELIAWISEGKTLREFCRKDEKPSYAAIYDWLEQDPVFSTRFAHARSIGHDVIAEETLHIANTPIEGQTITETEEGVTIKREDMLGHRKLQIDTRLKLLAKWNPKKWGDRTTIAGDDESPLVIEANFDVFGELLKNLSLKRQAGEQ